MAWGVGTHSIFNLIQNPDAKIQKKPFPYGNGLIRYSALGKLSRAGILVFQRHYRNVGFLAGCLLENNDTVDQRIERMILAHAYVKARIVYRTSLAHEYIAGFNHLASEFLYAKSFAMRFTSVL